MKPNKAMQSHLEHNSAIMETEDGVSINLGAAAHYSGNDGSHYAEDYGAHGTTQEQAAYDPYGEQMFLVITPSLRMYKDENLEIEDTENMFIEQDSRVLGCYINDYVVYLSEPYYVYVSSEDVQTLDTANVDGYQWDTGSRPQSQQQMLTDNNPAMTPNGLDNSGLTGILSHVPEDPNNVNSITPNGGQLGLPNDPNSGHATQSTTIIHDQNLNLTNDISYNSTTSYNNYNDADLSTNNDPMSIDAALASQFGTSPNITQPSSNLPNNGQYDPANSHSRSQSRSRSKQQRGRRPSSARSRTHSDYNGYDGQSQTPAQTDGNNTTINRHSRSHSRASQRSHHSHRSHSRSSRANTGTGTGATGDKDASPDTEGVSELSRSRRGSMSSVSTFMDIQNGRRNNHRLPMPGGDKDRDAATVEDGFSEDGSSVHYIAKSQLKSPLYYNQVANEILARRAVNMKDNSRQKETIVDNIIVNRFNDARPIPGKRYFTQSRRVKNGITVVIPFSNEPAQELETTLTQLYYTHEYLVTAKEEWKQRPFHILLIQDGWSQAHPSLQRYLKKMFPKQYYYNEVDPADINTNLNAIENGLGIDNISDGNQTPLGGASPILGSRNPKKNKHGKYKSSQLSEQNVGRLNAQNSRRANSAMPEWDASNINNNGLNNNPPNLEEQQSYEIRYDENEQSAGGGIEMSKSNDMIINYEDSGYGSHQQQQPNLRVQGSSNALGVGGGNNSKLQKRRSASQLSQGSRLNRAQSEASVSEYAPSIAMELPSQSQYWWEFHEEFDGSYKPSQGPITFIFEKTIDNPTYFALKWNKNEKGRHDKKIEHQLTLHLTLIVKLDRRGKHNSREWFLNRSGFAESYRSQYMMTTNAFTLYDIKTLYSLVDYLDRNPDCSVVTGRQRAMTRGMQGKKRTEYKCSMGYILRLTQTFDWELTNNIYNPTYNTVGFLPVVPGHCGLYRASDILQDNARDWYHYEVNADPKETGLVLGNLQHVEDRLLTYAAILKVQDQRRIGYVSDALFYMQITTNIEDLVDYQKEWINGTFAGFIYLLWTARWNFWEWQCQKWHKLMIFGVFLLNFIQMMMIFFAAAISFGMLRTSLSYLYENYFVDDGEEGDERMTVTMVFAWLLWLIHLTIHNTHQFHGMIIYLLFMISVITSLLGFFVYFMLIFADDEGIYGVMFKDYVTKEEYDFVGGLIFWCLFAPFPCSLIVGGFDSTLLLIKSIGAYLFTFHLMWGWLAPYALVRCWDIEFDSSDHADDINAADPLNNKAKDDREKMEARFLQKSRLVMILLVGCNIAAYMIPTISFATIIIFLISLGIFSVIAVFSAFGKSMGIDVRFFTMCCVLPENRTGAKPGAERDINGIHNPELQPQHEQKQREDSDDSNDGFITIPEVYKVQTKERYERMKNKGLSRQPSQYNGNNGQMMDPQQQQQGGQYDQQYDNNYDPQYTEPPHMQLDSVSQYSQARV